MNEQHSADHGSTSKKAVSPGKNGLKMGGKG